MCLPSDLLLSWSFCWGTSRYSWAQSLQVPFPHGGAFQGSIGPPGVTSFTSFSFFARMVHAVLLSGGMDGWKTLRPAPALTWTWLPSCLKWERIENQEVRSHIKSIAAHLLDYFLCLKPHDQFPAWKCCLRLMCCVRVGNNILLHSSNWVTFCSFYFWHISVFNKVFYWVLLYRPVFSHASSASAPSASGKCLGRLVTTPNTARTHPRKVVIDSAIAVYFCVLTFSSMSDKSNIRVRAVANVSATHAAEEGHGGI